MPLVLTRNIGKHVLSYFKTRVLREQFVRGVGGGRLTCNLPKFLMVSPLPLWYDRFWESFSRLNQGLNGHLHYPNNIDRSLNESPDDKIRKYRVDYNNNPLHGIIYVSYS